MKLIKKLKQNGFFSLGGERERCIVDYIIKEIRSSFEIGKG